MPDARPTSRPAPRRSFVARVTGLLAAWPVLGRVRLSRGAAAFPDTQPPTTQPNASLLNAVGDAVLPAELGPQGLTRSVAEFQRWMDAYQPGAEANHDGTGRIERLPADPRPQWRSQLSALEAEAQRTGQSFAALPRDQRQAMIRGALAGERGEAMPNPLAAKHVALALLAHFYDSPTATDLCYRAQIGRQQCRPLNAQREQPVALTRAER